MTTYARSAGPHTAYSSFSSSHDHLADAEWAISADDRAGPPLPRARLRSLARWSALALTLAGGAWMYTAYPAAVSGWASTIADGLGALLQNGPRREKPAAQEKTDAAPLAAGTDEAPPATEPPPRPAQDAALASPQRAAVPEPEREAKPAPQPAPEAAHPAREREPAPAPAHHAPPQAGSELDLLQKRAAAAGLHTELSRLLLESLSPADFRNAGIAVQTALAESADDAVLQWPKRPNAGEAAFQVHFVAGAAPGCRRYVVTIAKRGWLTTALPLERCGIRRKAPGGAEDRARPQRRADRTQAR